MAAGAKEEAARCPAKWGAPAAKKAIELSVAVSFAQKPVFCLLTKQFLCVSKKGLATGRAGGGDDAIGDDTGQQRRASGQEKVRAISPASGRKEKSRTFAWKLERTESH